jgi:hypothetical protein
MNIENASALPIYDRAIKRYPHLSKIKYAKAFCNALCELEAVQAITAKEYWDIAHFAEFGECEAWGLESIR